MGRNWTFGLSTVRGTPLDGLPKLRTREFDSRRPLSAILPQTAEPRLASGSVQQRATDRFGPISCNTPRQTEGNSEYQGLDAKCVQLFFRFSGGRRTSLDGLPKLRMRV